MARHVLDCRRCAVVRVAGELKCHITFMKANRCLSGIQRMTGTISRLRSENYINALTVSEAVEQSFLKHCHDISWIIEQTFSHWYDLHLDCISGRGLPPEYFSGAADSRCTVLRHILWIHKKFQIEIARHGVFDFVHFIYFTEHLGAVYLSVDSPPKLKWFRRQKGSMSCLSRQSPDSAGDRDDGGSRS
jgi:hypothetical protein